MKLGLISTRSSFGPFSSLLVLAAATALQVGCLTSDVSVDDLKQGSAGGGAGVTTAGSDPSANPANVDATTVKYRDIASHPGCTTEGLTYPPADIPGYRCAAKAHLPAAEDTSKPIVILIHGNSSTPSDYEKFPKDDPAAIPQLAERLVTAGFRAYAVDFRIDKVDDPNTNNDTENAAKNYDHGWAAPILEHLVDSVLTANPGRKIAMVAFSVGPTVGRDALRRLHRAKKKPFERISSLVWAAGAHHGVSTFRKLCGPNPTMRGRIACELGDRTAFLPTDFSKPLNGPEVTLTLADLPAHAKKSATPVLTGGAFETPCADGDTAFGQKGVCGGNTVKYTTVVMQDIKEGTFQDEFVSEGASRLLGADNKTVPLESNDQSGYFLKGLFKNHYGAIRSETGLQIIMTALSE